MSVADAVGELRQQIDALSARDRRETSTSGVPAVTEFVLSDKYLDQPTLYPRQSTFLKLLFLEADQLTTYDHLVLEELGYGYRPSAEPTIVGGRERWLYQGQAGLAPDVLERVATLKKAGRPWFRMVVAPMGRRAGKGALGAYAGAMVAWHILQLGDPRAVFGLPPGKHIDMPVFAGNYHQARSYQFADLSTTIRSAACFAPYVRTAGVDRILLASPADLDDGTDGTIIIRAAETTTLSARGPATLAQFWDEIAHIGPATSGVSVDAVFDSAAPALDQFREYAFTYMASSPAQQIGPFYRHYLDGLEYDPTTGLATHPDKLVIHQPSWGPYLDWERAHELATHP